MPHARPHHRHHARARRYASERRKAKILNFSIAYGKTAHGLAKDFGTSLEEAKDTVAKWYADRKEVQAWQEETRERARKEAGEPFVSTILGRRRPLPDMRCAAARVCHPARLPACLQPQH